jgi:hypothetical protein
MMISADWSQTLINDALYLSIFFLHKIVIDQQQWWFSDVNRGSLVNIFLVVRFFFCSSTNIFWICIIGIYYVTVLLIVFPTGINKTTTHLRDPRCYHVPSTLPLSVSHASLAWSHLSVSIDPLCHRPPPPCDLSTDAYVAPSAANGGHDEPTALVLSDDNQLGTPRVRCDEHNGKFSLSYETKV